MSAQAPTDISPLSPDASHLDKGVCWITGAAGLIGSQFVATAPPGWKVIGLSREHLDVADFSAVRARFDAERPQLIIHCAAISKSAECEQHPHLAWRVNTDATRVLSEVAADIPFFFFSTDLVFDGKKGNYAESDAPHPLTIYGKTKAAAESAVLKNPRHTVIRTSLNGGKSRQGDRSFTEQLVHLWKTGRASRLFSDEFRSPIMAEVTARAVWELAGRRATGLLHVAGAERLSRYEIGRMLARRMPDLHPRIERCSFRDYAGPARSPDTSLDSSKAQALLSFPLPRFSEWLENHWLVQPQA